MLDGEQQLSYVQDDKDEDFYVALMEYESSLEFVSAATAVSAGEPVYQNLPSTDVLCEASMLDLEMGQTYDSMDTCLPGTARLMS